jgi:hypothetical protein
VRFERMTGGTGGLQTRFRFSARLDSNRISGGAFCQIWCLFFWTSAHCMVFVLLDSCSLYGVCSSGQLLTAWCLFFWTAAKCMVFVLLDSGELHGVCSSG